MSTLGYILLFTFLGSIAALIGGLLLLTKENVALKFSHFLASFAAGTLLGSAFFDLLPEAIQVGEKSGINIFFFCLLGIVVFFILERSIHWFHHHEDHHEQHKGEAQSTVPLIIIGDTVHNFIDGVVIAATFLISIQLGIVTTIAVAAHEIPQEIGDFGLLLHKRLSRRKVLTVNVISAAAAFAGALIAYLLGDFLVRIVPIFLALTAGFFIYIASSDLIPEIHYEKRKGFAFIETVLLLLGVTVMWIATNSLHHG